MKIKITSDGQKCKMVDEDTGYSFPIVNLTYTIGVNKLGLLTVELLPAAMPGFSIDIDPNKGQVEGIPEVADT